MLPEEIKQLIENTPREERKIAPPTEVDAALEPLLIFQLNITKPNEESLLHHIRIDTPPIVRSFYDQHEKKLLNILKDVQTLRRVNAYHPLDIDLLAEAAIKHYLWKSEHNFKAEELHLSNTLRKELKRPFVNRLKEPPWIAREWDELMAFMITGRHLDVGPLTTEDIEKEQRMPVGFKELSSKGKGREPVTPQLGEGSKRQQRFRQETEGGDSVAKEAEYEADEEGSDHHEDETTRTTSAAPGPPGDSSSEESNSESDRPRSSAPMTKPRKATARTFEHDKSPEEQEWESRSGVIASRRTTSESNKALKGIKLDPPETLDGEDTKLKNSHSFDGWVNAWQRFLAFKDIDLNDRKSVQFIGFKVTNSALVFYNQF